MPWQPTRVADIMTRDPITVPGSAPLGEARRRLENSHITGLPVTDGDDRVIGVISQSDFLALSRHDDDGPISRHERRFVADAAARPALTIGSWAPVRAAARLLLDYGVHRLVVVDEDEHAVGILTTTDFVRLVAGEAG